MERVADMLYYILLQNQFLSANTIWLLSNINVRLFGFNYLLVCG